MRNKANMSTFINTIVSDCRICMLSSPTTSHPFATIAAHWRDWIDVIWTNLMAPSCAAACQPSSDQPASCHREKRSSQVLYGHTPQADHATTHPPAMPKTCRLKPAIISAREASQPVWYHRRDHSPVKFGKSYRWMPHLNHKSLPGNPFYRSTAPTGRCAAGSPVPPVLCNSRPSFAASAPERDSRPQASHVLPKTKHWLMSYQARPGRLNRSEPSNAKLNLACISVSAI